MNLCLHFFTTLVGFFLICLLPSCTNTQSISRSGNQMLVGYWGQNSALSQSPKKLDYVCRNSKYDIVAVSFIHKLFDPRNKDELPGINLGPHCAWPPVGASYPILYRCTSIETAVRLCQQNKKKVLLAVGGSTWNITIPSASKARTIARNLWHLFLGGNDQTLRSLRPFGSVVMDGINLDIEKGGPRFYSDLAKELRNLMNTDSSRNYLIAAAPQCPYPDAMLGPSNSGTALEDAAAAFDHLYVQFYNNYCSRGVNFDITLRSWLTFANRHNIKVFIGIIADVNAIFNAYRSPSDLEIEYKALRTRSGIGGIAIWDVSLDQANVINGKVYSEYAYPLLLRGGNSYK